MTDWCRHESAGDPNGGGTRAENILKDFALRHRYTGVGTTTASGIAGTSPSTISDLFHRLRDVEDQDAWWTFWRKYRPYVGKLLEVQGLRAHEVDEVAQQVFIKTVASLPGFAPRRQRGSFRRWLSRLTRWRLLDHVRRKAREVERFESLEEFDHVDGAAIAPWFQALDREGQIEVVQLALQRLLRRFDPLMIQVYWRLVLQEEDAGELARFYRCSRSKIYATRRKIEVHLRREFFVVLEALERRRLEWPEKDI